MSRHALNLFTAEVSKIWGPLSSSLTSESKALVEGLTTTCEGEDWVVDLIENQHLNKEIYRSEQHGFILMGHVEPAGLTSPPHDHGSGWVIYSVVQGSVEMGIFHRVVDQEGVFSLVQKDSYVVSPGESNIYLPGDIHDTKTLEDDTLMLRLTSCDFNDEVAAGRLMRYTANYRKW